METSSEDGLTVTFDDETNIFSFEWDEETHPEYNFIKDFTDEDFAIMMREYIDRLDLLDHDPETPDNPAEVPAG